MGFWKQTWHFIWDDDSIWSWLANIVLAFVIIKYMVYPGLGFMLGTQFPIVAVVSHSMYHDSSFDSWWEKGKEWYITNGITKEMFIKYSMKNGFNKGDIMILKGVSPEDTKLGDIIVFQASKPDPIIHRIVKKTEENGVVFYETKGDNYITNPTPIQGGGIDETQIQHKDQIVKGKAIIRIPYLGYIKLIALKAVCTVDLFGICPVEYYAI